MDAEDSKKHVNDVLLGLKDLEQALDSQGEDSFAYAARAKDSRLSFFQALESTGQGSYLESVRSRLTQMGLACRAPQSPILAVAGLLNAGKSSLVSTFLSPENRRRVLIGSANAQGTHRFVLWMPSSWRADSEIWSFILQRLKEAFGCDCEELAESPEMAAKQYNDTMPRISEDASGTERSFATISIPLIATDSALDQWGIAVMDCPDVQTGLLDQPLPASGSAQGASVEIAKPWFHERAMATASHRLNVLYHAAQICSAYLVVLPANAMHDQTVSQLMRTLREQMPSVQQLLAVNRVPRRYTSSQIREELKQLYRNDGIRRHYMAYSFEGPLDRERIPVTPPTLHLEENQPLPIFFRIDSDSPPQPPQPIHKEDFLLQVGSQLDKSTLARESLSSTLSQLASQLETGINAVESSARQISNDVEQLHEVLAHACYEFSKDSRSNQPLKGVRLHASRQIVQQISKSLERTAPWWAQPGRWTARIAQAGKEQFNDVASKVPFISWLQGNAWVNNRVESVRGWMRSRSSSEESMKIVTADRLLKAIRQFDRRDLLRLDDFESESRSNKVLRICQQAIDRFQEESRIELDDGQLDRLTSKMWSEMNLKQRLMTGLAPAGILFAPLLAVIMMPLDFGGSAVLVFASIKELLVAGAAGVGLAFAKRDSLPDIAESEAAWQQLGDLYAVLCDGFGIRRPSKDQAPKLETGSNYRAMPKSRIAFQVDEPIYGLKEIEIEQKSIRRIREIVQSIAIT